MNQEVYRSTDSKDKKWNALDPISKHPLCDTQDETQDAANKNKTLQLNEEYILIKDSCDVTVNSTDTKAAVNLQIGLQAAIAVLISISVASSETAEKLTQELLQSSKVKQISRQQTIVENSRNVDVSTTDTQAAVNIQILLQLLLALAVKLDIL
ncbi:spore coat protein [Evansella cellulosilytica]|uniref:Spore coat protein X/V n=1 Tax=Evansella cellulosilytica (strain ATCC 21833 / DSM 2522 / FERM P-1141 / JCM 9156 / N-4) TaxID=649639 RepID=E6TUZ8_EVAC2|nr:spore coat protein [Evansella cellulosilytica]ADU28581.1 Spore coat protein X/V [Evansella cellulosilytica DSM 2522]